MSPAGKIDPMPAFRDLRRRCLLLAWVLASVAPAGALRAEPQAAPAELFPAPVLSRSTPGLAPGREDFTRNDELEAALRALAASGQAEPIELGPTAHGQALLALHFQRGERRPVVLLIGQQHGNEPAPAEALLLLAQRLADPQDELAPVLAAVEVVLLARANPDGATLRQRGNADGVDINRDHLLLASAEARAVAALARRFDPIVVVDLHEFQAMPRAWVAQGLAARHDLLVQYATTANLNPALVRASEDWFRRPLWRDAAAAGLAVDWYHRRGNDSGWIAMGGVQPVLARNAFGLRHAVSLLLESRGLDLGRQHLARRVQTHLVALASVLRSAAEHAAALQGLRLEAARTEVSLACGGELVVEAEPQATRRPLALLDLRTGAEVVREVAWASALTLRASLTGPRPCAYWLDASAVEVVEQLRRLGVRVRTLAAPAGLQREGELFEAASWQAAAGDHLVPMDQPLAALAAAVLEPAIDQGWVARVVSER